MRTWRIAPPSGDSALLILLQGDLTLSPVQAIVNAANPALSGGGGVDGAIQRAAGPELLRAGRAHVRKHGLVATGQAVLTPGFDLSQPYVIHTVGPVWRGGNAGEGDLLQSAYTNCLTLAQAHDIQTLAFPAISCGAYGFPQELAAPLALAALHAGLARGMVREVHMYLRGDAAYELWLQTAETILRPHT